MLAFFGKNLWYSHWAAIIVIILVPRARDPIPWQGLVHACFHSLYLIMIMSVFFQCCTILWGVGISNWTATCTFKMTTSLSQRLNFSQVKLLANLEWVILNFAAKKMLLSFLYLSIMSPVRWLFLFYAQRPRITSFLRVTSMWIISSPFDFKTLNVQTCLSMVLHAYCWVVSLWIISCSLRTLLFIVVIHATDLGHRLIFTLEIIKPTFKSINRPAAKRIRLISPDLSSWSLMQHIKTRVGFAEILVMICAVPTAFQSRIVWYGTFSLRSI